MYLLLRKDNFGRGSFLWRSLNIQLIVACWIIQKIARFFGYWIAVGLVGCASDHKVKVQDCFLAPGFSCFLDPEELENVNIVNNIINN